MSSSLVKLFFLSLHFDVSGMLNQLDAMSFRVLGFPVVSQAFSYELLVGDIHLMMWHTSLKSFIQMVGMSSQQWLISRSSDIHVCIIHFTVIGSPE